MRLAGPSTDPGAKAGRIRRTWLAACVCSALVAAAASARAERSAPFPLDTRSGVRVAGDVESIAYSTAWNHGGDVRVAVDGVLLKEADAPASGEVVWNAAEAGDGLHTLTHESGGETLTAVFSVGKPVAAVTLGGLEQVYDGTAKTVDVKTEPEGLSVAVTYDGSGEAPAGAGSYAVRAEVEDDVWLGVAEGVLEIAKAAQTIEFAEIGTQSATNTLVLDATASSGLDVSYAVEGPAVADGNSLSFTGEGTVRVTASQAGDRNWDAAEDVERVFEVAKEAAPARARRSAPFLLDTRSGVRIAGESELLAYSTEWNHGGDVRVAADGIVIKEAAAPASGDVAWNAAEAGAGLHTLTHVSGGETLTAFMVVNGAGEPTRQWVSFDANGGTTPVEIKACEIGGTYGALPVPTWAGHVHLGWWTAAEGGERVDASGTVTEAAVRTLHAHWTADQEVAFDANGGTCGTDVRTYTMGGAYGELPEAEWTGYAWLGWFTAAAGGEPVTADSEVPEEAERTLWAQWRAETYAVSLDAQGGSGGTAGVEATYGAAMPGIAVPVRDGFGFKGYFTKTGGKGTQYYAADGKSARAWDLARGATLYAAWTELPKLALASGSRSFTADAASGKELGVTASVSWTAKSSASWLVLKTTGGKGNGKIVYNVAKNAGTASRKAKITVSGGGMARTFTVTQTGKTVTLTLGADSRGFAADAASGKELKVTANVAWTAKSPASWLTVKTASGSGNGKIVYNVAANTGTASRTGKITVAGGGLTRTFAVTQSGKPGGGAATLTLGAGERSFTADAANWKELVVTANVAWTAKSPASWLTVRTECGSGSGKIVYNVAANPGTSSRSATITVTGGGITRTFTAIQGGKPTGAKSAKSMSAKPKVWVTTSDGTDGDAVADGDEGTGWSPSGAEGAWVALTFEDERTVEGVEVVGENLPGGMRVMVSSDADAWSEEGGDAVSYLWLLLPGEGEVPTVLEIVTEP